MERARAGWVAGCAVAASMLVSVFGLDPLWLWGMVAGICGGILGLAASMLAARPWPVPARAGAAVLALVVGFFLLWAGAGYLAVMQQVHRSLR
jgi:hypothetical protein